MRHKEREKQRKSNKEISLGSRAERQTGKQTDEQTDIKGGRGHKWNRIHKSYEQVNALWKSYSVVGSEKNNNFVVERKSVRCNLIFK